ncbi:MAG: ssDNA-binding domain-containing protein [Bacteroidales bacterium]|nr:ssDNA-binding domain-containing protein [Bacteroidales bacterium]
MKTRTDHYTRITDAIVADLERGVRPWLKPWNTEHAAGRITRPLRANGQPYKGINTLMLWESALSQHFAAPIWMTFKQAKELGAVIKKGSQGTPVVYADRFTKTETGNDGQETERDIFFLKGYTVFNVEQIEGLPQHFYAPATEPLDTVARIEAADRFFGQTGADIRHGGSEAMYSPSRDFVQMPHFVTFSDAESYYATLAHEMTHWTRHPSRLDRSFGHEKYGDTGYAREELVAEIGAAFLCCDLGITPEPREDHAAYLGHWLQVLKEDKRAIFRAVAHAQRAVDFLHGLQSAEETPPAVVAGVRP